MSRTNSATYKNETIDAFEVDDNYNDFNRNQFKCVECGAQIQFNRGINKEDPHFKNWPNTSHQPNCEIELNYKRFSKQDNSNIYSIISTILPRGERLINLDSNEKKRKIRKRYFGKRSRQFLNSLNSLSWHELKELTLRTEDKKTVKLIDIIMRQDTIIEKLKNENNSFICILKGYTSKSIEVGKSIKLPLTNGGKYGNKNKFDLFIPASYVEKNKNRINTIENKLIYCYGVAEVNDYGYKIDLFSITHQVMIVEKANNSKYSK
ncbi:hypothetical protein [Tenacibaculum amylolyticum]|uniref:hypothetical protein n=1 Tax=Tenacibaculum amylolyticum TaxID=104269 RepID=UPI0038939A28